MEDRWFRLGDRGRYPTVGKTEQMQFRLRTLFVILTLAAVTISLLAIILPGPRSLLMGYERVRQRQFDDIEIGEPIATAIKILGEPIRKEKDFSREIAYRENDFDQKTLSKCVVFLVWRNGGNWFYCIGVDDAGKIVVKADGNS